MWWSIGGGIIIFALKYMTKQVFPKEEDYFLKQMGKELHCSQGFAMRMILQWH